MSRDLRGLLAEHVDGPTRPVDLDQLAAGARRRGRRRRTGSAGVIAAVLISGVLLPGVLDRGIGPMPRIAEGPGGGAASGDLPDGWRQVEVGGAVFGLPPEVTTVEVGRTDPVPCVNSVEEPMAFLAAAGFPTGDQVCNAALTTTPALLAAPLGTVPHRELEPDEGPWEVAPSGGLFDGLDPTVEVRVDAREPLIQRAFRFPDLDLYLSFSGADTFDRAILDTVTAREDAGADAATRHAVADGPTPTAQAAGRAATGAGPWRLVEGYGPEGAVRPTVDRAVTLEVTSGVPRLVDDVRPDRFDGLTGRWSGVDGCGPYELLVTVEGHEVTVSDEGGFVSYNLCHGEEQASRTSYLAALRTVDHLEIEDVEVEDGGRLVLTGQDTRLVFTPTALPELLVDALTATSWELVGHATAAGHGPAPDGGVLLLAFEPDGTFTAGTGCRLLEGTYEVRSDGRVTFDHRAEDDPPCPGVLRYLDDHVARLLSDADDARSVTVHQGAGLTLEGEDGATLRYRRAR